MNKVQKWVSDGLPYSSRPQRRKLGSGAGRICARWTPEVLAYICGRFELINGRPYDMVANRRFVVDHDLTPKWLLEIASQNHIIQVELENRPRTKTDPLKLLVNRIYKMYWWEGRGAQISPEHPLNRHRKEPSMMGAYQRGLTGRAYVSF